MKIHFTEKYLLNPQHPVTITLIGVGGTGSQVLACLARINEGLKALNHPGLFVHVFDDDIVTEANIGRQMFSRSDIGLNKAVIHVSRINRFMGLNWIANPIKYDKSIESNIIISCVDSFEARAIISKMIMSGQNKDIEPYEKMFYWMDFGNSKTTGQFIIGTIKKVNQPKSKHETSDSLPIFTQVFNKKNVNMDDDLGPSCSIAQALNKQDLFINSTLANLGCHLIWQMFQSGSLSHRGLYLNLTTLKSNPIAI